MHRSADPIQSGSQIHKKCQGVKTKSGMHINVTPWNGLIPKGKDQNYIILPLAKCGKWTTNE